MKKTFKKLLSIVMMLVLLVNTLAVLAFAEEKTPYQEETTNLTEDNLLLSMDDLKGTGLKVKENSGYTYTPGVYSESASVAGGELIWSDEDGDGKEEAIMTPASGMPTTTWTNWSYVGKTNLPLDEDKAYTIVFDFRWDAGVAFSYILTLPGSDLTVSQYIGMNSGKIICANKGGILESSSGSVSSAYGETIATASMYRGAYHTMMLSVDGCNVGVYVDGDYKGKFDFSTDKFTDSVLAIGGGNRVNKNNADMIAISMTDIKVYDGAYTKSVVTNAEDGDLLMHFDDFDLTDSETFTSEYDIEATAVAPHSDFCTVNGDIISYNQNEANFFYFDIDTTLPLDENSQYTIEYYLKRLNTNTQQGGMGYSYKAANDMRSFYIQDSSTLRHVTSGWYPADNGESFGFNAYERNVSADGYVRFTMTVNGTTASLYAGGVLLGTDTFNASSTNYLSICYKGHYTPATTDVVCTDEMLSIKNISIYQGIVEPNPTVNAIMPDGQTKQLEVVDGVINEFPTVECADDETVVWTYSKDGSNIVAQTPFEVVGDVALIAKIFNMSHTEVAGVQYTEPAEGKQNIRFIATLHSLKGSAVGFEITAKYMGDDGKLAQKDWDKNCNYVYSSINATTNGTVKTITAQELGGTYLVALSVDGVPVETDKQIDFYVKAYIVVNGQKVYSEEASCSIVGGEYKSDATLLSNAQ